jgi:hypothetical protein
MSEQRVVLSLRLGEGVRVGDTSLYVESVTPASVRVGGERVASGSRAAVVVRDGAVDAVALLEYDGRRRAGSAARLTVIASCDLRVTRLTRGQW